MVSMGGSVVVKLPIIAATTSSTNNVRGVYEKSECEEYAGSL
jgi:hypothetical protein